jgi:hypothetical protein
LDLSVSRSIIAALNPSVFAFSKSAVFASRMAPSMEISLSAMASKPRFFWSVEHFRSCRAAARAERPKSRI